MDHIKSPGRPITRSEPAQAVRIDADNYGYMELMAAMMEVSVTRALNMLIGSFRDGSLSWEEQVK